MSTILDDSGVLLAAAGVGVVGTTLFFEALPALPVACVALKEYGGAVPSFTLPATTGIATEYPRVQVLSRHTTKVAARAAAQLAYAACAKVVNQTVNGVKYLRMTPLQQPSFQGLDDTGAAIYSFNFETERVP